MSQLSQLDWEIFNLRKDRDRLERLFKIDWTASYGEDENGHYIEIEFLDRESLDRSLEGADEESSV